MSYPIISICCITYNQALYIRETLDGFVMQQCKYPFEIVISDDCSTDGTRTIIAEYKSKYPDMFRDVSPEKNLGVIENWKHVHQEAQGELIAFCEGDDYWTDPFKLQKQVEYMRTHKNCGLCVTDFCYQNDLDKEHISKPAFASKSTFQPQTFSDHLKNAGYIGPMTWMYRRCLFMQNITDYDSVTDGTLALALDLFGSSEVAYLSDVTAVYRIHSNSAANPSDIYRRMKYTKGVYRTQLHYAKKYNCSKDVIEKLKMQNYTTSMLLAVESNDNAFIQEAFDFYSSEGVNMKWFLEECRAYVYFKNQFLQTQASKAYRIGKILLKPFRWVRSM